MTTDTILGFDPADIIIGPEGRTLTLTQAATAPRTVRVATLAHYREYLARIVACAVELRAAGVDRIMVDLSVDAPPDGVEFVVRAADPDDDATVPAWATSNAAIASYVRPAAFALLPGAARALGALSLDATIYVRAVGGYWVPESAGHQRAYAMLAVDDASVSDAALHGWAVCGAPRDAYVLVVPAHGGSMGVFVNDYTLSMPEPHYERVHAFQPLRVTDSEREVGDADPIVRAIHRTQTTGLRAASRIRAAKAALVQYVLDEEWIGADEIAIWVREGGDSPLLLQDWHSRLPGLPGTPAGVAQVGGRSWTADEGARIVAALVAFELHGVGGPGGFSGGATATMSWRGALGKGRRQASDGGAWDSAIEACGSRDVSPADALLAVPHVRPVDLEWPMAYALDRAYGTRTDAEESRAWCAVARAVMARAEEPGSPSASGALALGWRYGVR